ncbi:polysaccharide biosynthesis protein [Sporosarcina sp. P21c]|uniref:putative polysaccharide biosynthesis protein n=1 Tax=Sporosarcina TaxID=1569 RepID=UPI000A165BD2|nr:MULTISPECIES: polysaccharide biosynthesis protein [Sporosarcina]ARJ38058.1 cell division protein [Sporosarcina ureae]PIC66721.1 polysaccharide biosynthesis protein [Sporosarcina sp. P16a]PIC83475.1 polysaccharide biosynthesis protein [Sporosarcina sp. P1]PIC89856.1 polysaccharide biosynthesis protein [Sporosarcina sp. P21c]PIC93242.1 polysaccharide biosynthesis protein [Sporosarcina sp. P25]
MASNLLKGTAILTIGLFLSKALGLLYVIPFYAIVGEKSVGLYQYAYIPYNLALAVAVSGAPLAISKFVSKYNALGDYATGRKLMKSGMLVMSITGFLSFLALFLLANPIAQLVIKSDEQIFTVQDITTVIRWVSFALLAVPLLSIGRGFLQGYQKFEPTSVSQLIEQIVRIVVVLVGAFLVVNVLDLSPKIAVQFAVFAAFIGALAGLWSLYYYWKRYQDEFDYLLSNSPPASSVSLKQIYTEVLAYVLPFVLVGTINPIYQFVDMITFNGAMKSIGLSSVSDLYLTKLNFLTHKIVMIPVMVATGFSMALISIITKDYTSNNEKGITRSLDQTYQIMLFLTIPMVIGLMVLSSEVYQFLYAYDVAGASVLASYAPVAILFAMFTVTAAILQGIDHHKWIVFTSLLGLLVKMLINIPLIKMFEVNGAIIATAIGYSVAVCINLFVIKKALNYKSEMVIRRLFLILAFNAVMFAGVWLTNKGLNMVHIPVGRWQALLYVMIGSGVGMVIYGFLAIKSGLAQQLFGDRLTRIMRRFGLGG